MTKTALLHIGTSKTGTTSIQRWLAHAQREGQLGPVRYPLWKSDSNHQRLMGLYKPYDELTPLMHQQFGPSGRSYRRMMAQYRDYLFGELHSSSGAVISAESLARLFAYRDAARLRADLESLGFQQFHVVLYVRDPAEFFLSSTQQRLKSTAMLPLIRDPESFRYPFLRTAQTWEQAFPDSLIVRRFPTEPDHDVIEDFAAVLQRCLGVAPLRVPLRANTTLSAEGMQILQDYREPLVPDNAGNLTPEAAGIVRFLSESVGLPQTKPVLKKDVAERIHANHAADAEVLHSRYGVDLGLRNCVPAATKHSGNACRVDELLEFIDPEIVRELLLRLARYGDLPRS